ncbi:MAG: class II SORL domain-containing protein [Candidatus Caldatribacterium sp.]|uniref:class II SORL domain-containing protein n=1 Tax=Candidatus Caldatribacterium sp. TaxID=2282143 RepID=UPI002993075D|nr:class II SORL domain-containing protein [Candidatus Caldatribacterium sp.]MCX7730304.1 class II SORL domain-containing protein [Candidatus Caldatribacterium sp.]MDW8080364.1 class II SORL domain-containing protein [Candidatus Calescibacterium sp.]
MAFADLFQSADWKQEKHVPVIEGPDAVRKGEVVVFQVTVGKEIPHPNTTEHHIRWIALYFAPEGEKFPYELGRMEFTAHGESVAGANQGPAYTQPQATFVVKLDRSGVLYATSYCNIHGFWRSEKPVTVT